MKMFKKLMAVALAGVLALTVLTGCGSSVDRKEFVRYLNDNVKFLAGSGMMELSDAGKEQAGKVIALVQEAYNKTADDEKADFDPMDALQNSRDEVTDYPDNLNPMYKSVEKALGLTKDTKDNYLFSIVTVDKNTSEYNQKYATSQLAQKAMARENLVPLVNGDGFGNKGTVSFDTVTLGDTEYLVVVVKIIA